MKRCEWVGKNPLMIKYHDEEWGVPLHDDTKLFEFLLLDTFQAGLSWQIILNKREAFRKAFDNFDAEKIAKYDTAKINELIQNKSIIRNRRKIEAAVNNARKFLQIKTEFGSFDKYIWQFTKGKVIKNHWQTESEIPSSSPESEAMSNDLKKRGFKFVGSTICYAFMQAAGMINDHLVSCFRYKEL
ncbi:MAG: DNA-3-methyladenine glycosylase I [Candidatus Cloacimonadota bacterium]|nr:MAG: DNA-3-methyladenine glycosylase I [Candidatus Cloacimonadota bacterium]